MPFHFPNPKTTDPREQRVQRNLEVIPALLTWTTLIGMFVFSFLLPVWVAVFIILFDIYWIYRTIFIAYYSVRAYRRLAVGKWVDWRERCQKIGTPRKYAEELRSRLSALEASLSETRIWRERRIMKKESRRLRHSLTEVEQIIPLEQEVLDWRQIVHTVLLPTAGESAAVIEPALQSLAESNFPKSQIIVVLATEERELEGERLAKVQYLQEKFSGVFGDFLVTTHRVAEGEMKCKASNATFAARELTRYLDARSIDYSRVIFSNFDCDSVVHPQYFAALTYAYITDPKRLQRAYQPLPMYHNNLWDTNAFVRVVVTGSSFWHMFQSTRREMVTFSSHSEAFATLVKVDFWPVNMISEDSIIYWKGYAYFHGDYMVRPIYLPISLDAVLAETYWKTIVNQYKQKRRWAYGIENFPIIMRALWPDKRIPLREKLRVAFEMLEGHHAWATAAFILAFLGWLPLILGNPAFRESVLAHNLPFITRTLMTIGMIGLIVSMSLSFLLLPPKPSRYKWTRYLPMIAQWMLAPIIAPTLGAIPAIESQTRLLFKKYFGEFWVTEKIRKS